MPARFGLARCGRGEFNAASGSVNRPILQAADRLFTVPGVIARMDLQFPLLRQRPCAAQQYGLVDINGGETRSSRNGFFQESLIK